MEGGLWQAQLLPVPDLDLAWYEAGSGPAVLWLSGGPGDDHRYLRPVAEPLLAHFRCILYDQRGTGGSRLGRLDGTTLHVERFLADIEALRMHLGQARLRLVGHSWGATLALLYGVHYPERVERLALLGLGPLSDELAAIAQANLLRPLSPAERERWALLAAQRRAALATGDLEAHREAHLEMVTRLSVRSLVYSPEIAGRFAELYRAGYSYNPLVAPHLLPSVDYEQLRAQLRRIAAPLLVLYGYQDFEPITQAYLLKEQLRQVQVCLLNQCGHVPWLEQPEAFYRELIAFLRS